MTERCSGDAMEPRLIAWGAWLAGAGRGMGYPVTNVLHESWLPPTPGQTPTMQAGGGSDRLERELHGAMRVLSLRLQNTLVVCYVMRASVPERVRWLECEEATVRARIAQAKRMLMQALEATASH